jgi:hypothetical protein
LGHDATDGTGPEKNGVVFNRPRYGFPQPQQSGIPFSVLRLEPKVKQAGKTVGHILWSRCMAVPNPRDALSHGCFCELAIKEENIDCNSSYFADYSGKPAVGLLTNHSPGGIEEDEAARYNELD